VCLGRTKFLHVLRYPIQRSCTRTTVVRPRQRPLRRLDELLLARNRKLHFLHHTGTWYRYNTNTTHTLIRCAAEHQNRAWDRSIMESSSFDCCRLLQHALRAESDRAAASAAIRTKRRRVLDIPILSRSYPPVLHVFALQSCNRQTLKQQQLVGGAMDTAILQPDGGLYQVQLCCTEYETQAANDTAIMW
jgi:hypothetical protein